MSFLERTLYSWFLDHITRWRLHSVVPIGGSGEMLHSFKTRKIEFGLMALKLYLQKAYDRMNWSFLKVVVLKYGFNETFVNWTMAYVSMVSFEVLVNGAKLNQFRPSRGLWQGDPLSSYLFILGQEILSIILNQEFELKVLVVWRQVLMALPSHTLCM